MTTRWKSIAAVVAAATAAFALAGHPAGATAPPTSEPGTPSAGSEGTITVTAEGTVRVEPDTAVITLGVQANAATGAEAMEQINASSTALTQALTDAGIPAEDIQTSGLSLFSTTDDTGRGHRLSGIRSTSTSSSATSRPSGRRSTRHSRRPGPGSPSAA